jgi:aldehyde:ferredoxin oxidoreductase
VAKMIKVDLSKEKIETLALRDDLFKDYIGCEGIGSWLLWEMLKLEESGLKDVADELYK